MFKTVFAAIAISVAVSASEAERSGYDWAQASPSTEQPAAKGTVKGDYKRGTYV